MIIRRKEIIMSWTAVLIVGIICWAIVAMTQGGKSISKKDKVSVSEMQNEHEQLKAEIVAMAERLAVLEKIVTDEKYQLNKEFESLKD